MKTVNFIANNDQDFYNDMNEYLEKKDIVLKEFEYKPNFLLPNFVKKYKLDNEIKKENNYRSYFYLYIKYSTF